MNSLYEKDNMLPYVVEQHIAPPPKQSIFKRKSRNELSMASLVASLSSIVLGFLIFPSVMGLTLATGALIISIKRGLSKKLPIISLVISAVTLALSTVGLVWVGSLSQPTTPPYIPPTFTYVSHSGIAYKYNPISNIPCDSLGSCSFEVKLFQVDEELCTNGGTFNPDMEDMASQLAVPAKGYDFPAMKQGESQVIQLELNWQPNTRLIERTQYTITCK